MAERLILIRHGESTASGGGRLNGRRDVPLSARGRAQAGGLREVLAPLFGPGPEGARDAGPDARPQTGAPPAGRVRCFASPLERARQTAALALDGLGPQAEVLRDLIEVDVGEWEGLTYAEAALRDPEEAARWACWDPTFAFPGGESIAAFQERVRTACDCLRGCEESTVVAFTHGGVIRMALCALLGFSSREYLVFDVGPACVATVRVFGDLGVLTGLLNTATAATAGEGP